MKKEILIKYEEILKESTDDELELFYILISIPQKINFSEAHYLFR